MEHIGKKYVSNILIPIPSVNIQKQIIEQYDIVNNENELLTKQIENNKNKLHTVLQNLLESKISK